MAFGSQAADGSSLEPDLEAQMLTSRFLAARAEEGPASLRLLLALRGALAGFRARHGQRWEFADDWEADVRERLRALSLDEPVVQDLVGERPSEESERILRRALRAKTRDRRRPTRP